MFFCCQCLFLLFLWLHLHIFASLRRVKFLCVLVSFVWRLEETVMCSVSLNLNGCWCMSDWDTQVTLCKGRCFLGILPPTIMQVENGSPRNLFRYKPMGHFPLQTMILEGRWRHAHDMFIIVLIRTPSQKKIGGQDSTMYQGNATKDEGTAGKD